MRLLALLVLVAACRTAPEPYRPECRESVGRTRRLLLPPTCREVPR